VRPRRHPITILGTLLVAFLWASASASLAIDGTARNACRTVFVAGSRFAVCTIDLRRHKVRLFWTGLDGQAYGSFDRLRQGRRGSQLVVAMNGGMSGEDLAPVGLFIDNAWFLDGSVSSLDAPQRGRKDGLRPMGPSIGILRRR
jgi:uncharacterized protein YigE (DUF2233 family)